MKERLETDGLPTGLSPNDIQTIVAYAKSIWPPPCRLPSSSPHNDWSSAWESWPYLLTFYWHSPHYLQIPQIDMIANILYRLPGRTRGVLFSNERCQFIFTFHKNPNRFFLYDMYEERLYEFEGVRDEDQLVSRIEIEEKEKWGLKLLEPDPDGQDAIRRIMERDESVIPVLTEQFLDYTPEHTTPWQENQPVSEFLNEEQRERLERLAGELASQKHEIGKEEEEKIVNELVKEFEGELKGSQEK
ncbi:hypothetical protein JOM56_007900 [Amanita muscaria]